MTLLIIVIYVDLKLLLEKATYMIELKKKAFQIVKDVVTNWQATCKTHSVPYDPYRPPQFHSSSSLNHFEESHSHSHKHEHDSHDEGHGHSHDIHHTLH